MNRHRRERPPPPPDWRGGRHPGAPPPGLGWTGPATDVNAAHHRETGGVETTVPAMDETPAKTRGLRPVTGRAGYDPRFLGVDIPLPTRPPDAGSALVELSYTHFTVL